jgi:predicted transposase YdaD
MRRDSIFYKLFQQSPILLFELLTKPSINAEIIGLIQSQSKNPSLKLTGYFYHQKMKQLELCISVRYGFRKTNSLIKGYLRNLYCISTAIVQDLAIGKQRSFTLHVVLNKAIFIPIGHYLIVTKYNEFI